MFLYKNKEGSTEKELCLSRANKSVRIFEHVVDLLSQGKQPDTKLLYDVGYLYRTTAVYGSGKFGLADRIKIQDRGELKGPFRLEMMLVSLARQFTFDMVNHVAKMRSPKLAVKLSDDIARNLGIGNSTGLGWLLLSSIIRLYSTNGFCLKKKLCRLFVLFP